MSMPAVQDVPRKTDAKTAVLNAGLFLVGMSLLGWSIYSNRDQLRQCLGGNLGWTSIVMAFALYSAGMMMAFVRWYFLVRMLGISIKLSDSLRLSFVGGLFNLIIPGAVGGDFVKAAFLSKMQVPKVRVYSSMVIDRFIGLLGLFLLASIAGLSAWPTSPPQIHRLTIFALIVTTGLIVFLGLIFSGILGKNSERMAELNAMSAAYRGQLPAVGFWVVISIGVHVCNTWAFYEMSRGILPELKVGLAEHFQIVPLVLFSTAVPLPLGAIGLSENVSEFLFKSVGHSDGAIAMMGFRILQFGFAMIAATVYLTNFNSMKRLTESNQDLP